MKNCVWILAVIACLFNGARGFTEDACEGDDPMRAWCHSTNNEWLVIDDVFFGRMDTEQCPHETAPTNTTACIPDLAALLAKVNQVCSGRKECKVPTQASALGDPCPGYYKYANVTYRCRPCQNSQGDAECGERKALGHCETQRTDMDINCFKACSRCEEFSSSSDCDNIHGADSLETTNLDCDFWAIGGDCYDPYVQKNCQESCKLCAEETVTTKQACEGEHLLMECENPYYFLDLQQVRYGRFDTSFCEHETAENGENCTESEVALERVRRACEGRQNCTASIKNAALDPSDPCPDVAKQVAVTYKCRLCENKLEDAVCKERAKLMECEFNRNDMMENCFAECSGCRDSVCGNDQPYSDCDFWSMQGECTNNPNWMPYQCSQSCRTCDCKNEAGGACDYWESNGECSKNPTWMPYHCAKACGTCFGCVNSFGDDNQCKRWAAAGECDRNPFWMLYNCEHACYSCFDKIGEFQQGFCESSPNYLHCANEGQKIRISDIFYGRRNNDSCPHETYSPEVNCSAAEDKYQVVIDTCNGMKGCYINANEGIFEDPCPGIVKQLEVSYFCQDCVNKLGDAECETMRGNGECDTDPERMLDGCFQACTKCTPMGTSECVNEHAGADCDWWAMTGQCDANWQYMHRQCAQSCRFCP